MGPTDFSSDLSFGFCGQLSEGRMTNSLPIVQIVSEYSVSMTLVSIQHLSEGCKVLVMCPPRDLNPLLLGSESYSLSTRPPRLAYPLGHRASLLYLHSRYTYIEMTEMMLRNVEEGELCFIFILISIAYSEKRYLSKTS